MNPRIFAFIAVVLTSVIAIPLGGLGDTPLADTNGAAAREIAGNIAVPATPIPIPAGQSVQWKTDSPTPVDAAAAFSPRSAMPSALPPIMPSPTPPPMFPAGPSLAAASDMIGFSRELAGGTQAITLINASRRWMAVYHVDHAGQIRLVSSRPLDADFSFQFNATAPLPDEIRRLQGG